MPRTSDEKRIEIARIRFVQEGWDIKAIAEEAKVAERTIRTWKKTGEWDTERKKTVSQQQENKRCNTTKRKNLK